VLVSQALDAPSRAIVRTYAHPLRRRIDERPYDGASVQTLVVGVDGDVAAVVVQQPNALGVVEDVRAKPGLARRGGALVRERPGVDAGPGRVGPGRRRQPNRPCSNPAGDIVRRSLTSS
jgi:hypothetical protein